MFDHEIDHQWKWKEWVLPQKSVLVSDVNVALKCVTKRHKILVFAIIHLIIIVFQDSKRSILSQENAVTANFEHSVVRLESVESILYL